MIKANFNAYGSYVTDSLYQWDLNQVLQVIGLRLDVAPEVHFANADMDRAIPRQATLENGVMKVDVPNTILQHPLRIHAYIGIYEGDTFKVVEKVEIPVIPKKRPTDYVFEDTDGEIYSYNNLENQIANIRDLWIETHNQQVKSNVYAWLDEHPEATTTVQDGALTEAKFSDDLKLHTIKDYVTPQMFGAKGDGVTDDTTAIKNAFATGKSVLIADGDFLITETIYLPSNATIFFVNAKVVKTNGENERIFEANGVNNIKLYNACFEGGGSDNNVSDQGSAILFYNCDNVYVNGLKTRNTFGDGLQLRNCNGRFENIDIDDYGRNAISPTSGTIQIINATLGTGLSGANPSCNIDIEPNSSDEKVDLLVSNTTLHDRINIYDAYSTENLAATVRIENCHFIGMYRAIMVKAVNNVSGENIHIDSNNVFDSLKDGGITIDNVNDVILNGLKFVNTSPAKINLVNITSNIGLKNIKSFYLYGAECEDLLIENCKIGYYEVTNAINAVFKNCQMNRFSTAIAFENGDFDSVTEQSFSSGSGFSVSVPIPINTVKNYLIVVNANGRTATLKTAIITVVNGSANSEVYELASYGELSVTYEIANDMLKITPSDNYGGTITVKAI